ncbi:hypothetical protein [Flavivirga jejuensis]|uniref:Uncharacterized protein n=1 Tax=Flavivirga jejuensis TaxID=870487 RepID=A0ABT8WUC0_9FLAO|nr:hypothetical protein [Flavivirga jejuensis]MDO5976783.1 hypothetical protein [Flavivirga jejuensis]
MKKIGILTMLAIFILNCSSDNNQDTKSVEIIFGEIYGLCAGDCRQLYLLTEQGVYTDSNKDTEFGDLIEISDWENTTFENQPLSIEKFDLAKQLLQIPNSVLQSNDEITKQVIADFDYFIQIKSNGIFKTFVFDEIKQTANFDVKQYFENMIDINNQLGD